MEQVLEVGNQNVIQGRDEANTKVECQHQQKWNGVVSVVLCCGGRRASHSCNGHYGLEPFPSATSIVSALGAM